MTDPMIDPMIETLQIDLGDVQITTLLAGAGPLVLCAHGFPDGPRSFRAQLGPLVAAGYRVACPAMRGYAPSSVSRSGTYDPAALGRDLVGLADALSPGQPVRLVGHDWGAVAAYAATALSPGRFSHLVTMAVPHLRPALKNALTRRQAQRSWYMGLFQLPLLAERRLAADNLALIDRLWRDWSPGYTPDPIELAQVKAGIRDRIGPVLAPYRASFRPQTLLNENRRLLLARTQVPALHLHGQDDGCIGVEITEGMESAFTAGLEVHRLAGVGHFLHLEQPATINSLILRFLGRS